MTTKHCIVRERISGKVSAIYQIAFLGKIYIGSSHDVAARWNGHLRDLRAGKHHSNYLQRRFNKHPEGTLEFSILELVDNPDSLIQREQHYLDLHKPFGKAGYNVAPTAGNCRGIVRTEEYIRKSSEARIGKRHMTDAQYAQAAEKRRGRKQPRDVVEKRRAGLLRVIAERPNWGSHLIGRKNTPEQIAKMAASLRGRKLPPRSEEWRESLRAAAKLRKRTPEEIERLRTCNIGRKGPPKSDETRAKISAALKGRKFSPEHIEKVRLSRIGKRHSQESIEKMRARMTGKKLPQEWRDAIRMGHLRRKKALETNMGLSA
jgi:group I intron endonuclease